MSDCHRFCRNAGSQSIPQTRLSIRRPSMTVWLRSRFVKWWAILSRASGCLLSIGLLYNFPVIWADCSADCELEKRLITGRRRLPFISEMLDSINDWSDPCHSTFASSSSSNPLTRIHSEKQYDHMHSSHNRLQTLAALPAVAMVIKRLFLLVIGRFWSVFVKVFQRLTISCTKDDEQFAYVSAITDDVI